MFNNLREMIVSMADEKSCREYLAKNRWENGEAVCPYCGHGKCYVIENGERYKCANKDCFKRFRVTVGNIFHASNIPLTKWFMAVYVATGHKKGISSYQLAKDIGVTQKTGWFMLHRIREAMRSKEDVMLDAMVEVDETWTGGKMKNKHVSKRKAAHEANLSHTDNKTAVMGYLQREGVLKLNKMDLDKTLKQQVIENVKPEAVIITDGLNAYKGLDKTFEAHETVNHKEDEYVRGDIHTNSIEGAFGLFKRMVFGIYNQITPKHLDRYCDEFTYRYNSRKLKDADRFALTLSKIEGKLPYKILVHGKSS
ncbi:IS1595 family transposase [soil metagenome]